MMSKDTYEQRKVAEKVSEEHGKIGVSTCWTEDEGYETALLDSCGVHPVQRYRTKKLALAGHRRWTQRAKKITTKMKILELNIAGLSPIEYILIP